MCSIASGSQPHFPNQIVSDSKAQFFPAVGSEEIEPCISFLGLLSRRASGLNGGNVSIQSLRLGV